MHDALTWQSSSQKQMMYDQHYEQLNGMIRER